MTTEYNHYTPSYEQRFREAETADFQYTRKEINPLPNGIYKHPLQFYDSPLKNSHLYPGLWHIQAVDHEVRPPNIGAMVDKSIQDNRVFAFGPYVLPVREYNYKS